MESETAPGWARTVVSVGSSGKLRRPSSRSSSSPWTWNRMTSGSAGASGVRPESRTEGRSASPRGVVGARRARGQRERETREGEEGSPAHGASRIRLWIPGKAAVKVVGAMTDAVAIGRSLSLEALEDVARRGRPVVFGPEERARVTRSRAAIDAITRAGDAGPPVYGVNTGFGALSETRISAADVRQLQKNLVRSHSTGIGPDLGVAEVRGMMLLRAQVLGLGASGVRPELIDLLCEMLDKGVHPRIPAQGSVGASGDLAPLAHLALAMIGEGEARVGDGPHEPASEALARAGVKPVALEAKEGLALINGTQLMASLRHPRAPRTRSASASPPTSRGDESRGSQGVEPTLLTPAPPAAARPAIPGQAVVASETSARC